MTDTMIDMAREILKTLHDGSFDDEYIGVDAYNILDGALLSLDAEIAQLKSDKEAMLKALRHADLDCDSCDHNKNSPNCDARCDAANFDCETCEAECVCKSCFDNSKWSWKG